VRRFVRHVQAFFARGDLEAAFVHAPDLFFARLAGVPQPLRERLSGWLQGAGCMASAPERP
jgi:hypothetical protein